MTTHKDDNTGGRQRPTSGHSSWCVYCNLCAPTATTACYYPATDGSPHALDHPKPLTGDEAHSSAVTTEHTGRELCSKNGKTEALLATIPAHIQTNCSMCMLAQCKAPIAWSTTGTLINAQGLLHSISTYCSCCCPSCCGQGGCPRHGARSISAFLSYHRVQCARHPYKKPQCRSGECNRGTVLALAPGQRHQYHSRRLCKSLTMQCKRVDCAVSVRACNTVLLWRIIHRRQSMNEAACKQPCGPATMQEVGTRMHPPQSRMEMDVLCCGDLRARKHMQRRLEGACSTGGRWSSGGCMALRICTAVQPGIGRTAASETQ